MKSTGIIVEYNPFHNGHKYHINKTKETVETDVLIAVMSGNYVQRGEPALIDKWKRTEMALNNEIDLIIELPSIYSCQSAEIFSLGAVSILNKIGVDSLVFGSENGNVDNLKKIAEIIIEKKEEIDDEISKNIKNGLSYPNVLGDVLKKYTLNFNFEPNNILGIEYLKTLIKLNSKIKTYTIKREKAGYNDKKLYENIASATAIREKIFSNNFMEIKNTIPDNVFSILKQSKFLKLKSCFDIIKYKIIMETDNLKNIQDMEEGFENKLYVNAVNCNNFEEFYSQSLTKRLTMSRLNRILIHIFLDITKEKTEYAKKNADKYIRVLGFNENGKKYLNHIKNKENMNIITNIKGNIEDKYINFIMESEIKVDNIYKILSGDSVRKIPIVKN